MTRLSAREREDDARKGYDLSIAALREINIRRGQIHPDPSKPEEVRWAAEGPCLNRELETVRRGK